MKILYSIKMQEKDKDKFVPSTKFYIFPKMNPSRI